MRYVITNNFGMSQFIDGENLYMALLSKSTVVGDNVVSVMEESAWKEYVKMKTSWWYKLAKRIHAAQTGETE